MSLEISSIKCKLVKTESKVKALATVVFNDALAVHGIKVIQGNNGLFVAMPSRKGKEDEYFDVVHPVTAELRTRLQDLVLESYQEMDAAETV